MSPKRRLCTNGGTQQYREWINGELVVPAGPGRYARPSLTRPRWPGGSVTLAFLVRFAQIGDQRIGLGQFLITRSGAEPDLLLPLPNSRCPQATFACTPTWIRALLHPKFMRPSCRY